MASTKQDKGQSNGKQDHQNRPDKAKLQQPRPEQQPGPAQQPGTVQQPGPQQPGPQQPQPAQQRGPAQQPGPQQPQPGQQRGPAQQPGLQQPGQQQPGPQQQGPAQLQVGPSVHAPPGPYPNQGPPIAGQPQGMMQPGYNPGAPGPYPPQGPPVAGQPQPILYPGNNQGYPLAIQMQPQILSPGYNQGYPQAIQTQPQIFSPGYNQGSAVGAIAQMAGLGKARKGPKPSPSGNFDTEGPSVGVSLGDEDDDNVCISAEVECGEVSKGICSGFTTCILSGPIVGCNIGFDEEAVVGCDLTLCAASCIFGSCLATLGLGIDTRITCSQLCEAIENGCEEPPDFEVLGIGIKSQTGFAVAILGSAIGYVNKEKKAKYDEKRQRRKDRKEEKRMQKEQAVSQPEGQGVEAGVTNNGASVEDAL